MRWNIICAGSAGHGSNFASKIISQGIVDNGYYVFASREYESRIRGGHNYNIITFSDEPISSNSVDIDILIALDDLSENAHKNQLKNGAIVIKEQKNNIKAIGQTFKILGFDFLVLDNILKKLTNYNENVKEAKLEYDLEIRSLKLPKLQISKEITLLNGSDGIAYGAVQSGLDFYYSYPMTPATGLLFSLDRDEKKSKYVTIQLESEIAVVNAAIGSAIAGAKSMVGTSGGGFDLMTEALSLAGGAQIPLVMYLAQRSGPSTGAPTRTGQEDLNMARHSGHGEIIRLIVAPGDPTEAAEKTSEIFYLTQKYELPGIILSDKHLAESLYSSTNKVKIIESKKRIKWPARYNSYIADDRKIANDSMENMNNVAEKRKEKFNKLLNEIDTLVPFEIYGKKNSKNAIIGWGSTKGAILDATAELDCQFIQLLYLEPFSKKIKTEIEKAENIIIVENNSTSMLSSLITEKTGILINEKNKILKYDGRPFMYESLKSEIKKRLK